MKSQFDHIGLYFSHYAQEFRDHPMIKFYGKTFKYSDVYRHAQALAYFLSNELSLNPGTRIGIMVPNTPQFAVVFLAAQLCGLITVAINPLYTKREVKQIMEHADIRCMFVIDFKAHIVAQSIKGLKHQPVVITTAMGDMLSRFNSFIMKVVLRIFKNQKSYKDKAFLKFNEVIKRFKHKKVKCVKRQRSDLAMLQYTSGTTGKAKGVMLSHQNILSNIDQVNVAFSKMGIKDGSKQLLVLPFFHIYGLSVFLNGIKHSLFGVLVSNPKDTGVLIKTLDQEKPEIIPIINTLMVNLMQSKKFKKIDFSWLKVTITGGMATQATVANDWQKITGCVVNQGYGLSETAPIVSITTYQQHDKFLSHVGKPLAGTTVKFIDNKGKCVKTGHVGELCVKGPQVMHGYWRSLKETAAVLKNGWFRTGDLAYLDECGNLKIVDRIKDMIVVSGFNVFPSEVEKVLNQHEQIIETAVVGSKDNEDNEVVKAFVVVKGAISEQDLKVFCKESLAAYKVPSVITFVDEIPKSHVGKVLKRSLKQAV
ncbi:MAG: AMP-binding protein [Pseudomonadota bacterium]|nr:AMP-binding protein [Pseudomonadota bacterium]